MRAARFYSAGDIRLDEIDEPQVTDGKVLVEVEWCGICGSELHEWLLGPITIPKEPHPLTGGCLPMALGHELAGRIKNPPPGSRFKDDEAVMVDPRIYCGDCITCNAGKHHCCKKLGYVGGSAAGGYQERIAVQERMLHPLGDIPIEYAAVIEPLAVVHHAVKESGITDWKDRSILILGGGPIGFALILDLKAHGATNIIVSEPTVKRRQQVSEFAQTTINPIEENVGDRCRDLTGGEGVDVVFDCAGVPVALEAGFDAIRPNGLYINIAVWEKPLTLPCWQFLMKHITFKGVLIFTNEDFEEVMEWMQSGKLVGYEKMVTSRIDVKDIVEKGFDELVNNKDEHIKIMVTPKKGLVSN